MDTNQSNELEHLLCAADIRDWPEDEKQAALPRIEKRDEYIRWLYQYKAYTEAEIMEYALEAEHQDGVEYWDHFNNPHDLATDIRAYVNAARSM